MDEPVASDDRPAAWRTALARSVGPAGFLLALLLLALLPVAGVSCDPDTGGPAHLCYTGAQLVTGTPSIDMSDIYAGSVQQTAEFRDAIVNTVAPPGAVLVLAAVAAVLLAAGALSALISPPAVRDAVAAIAAVAGLVLVVVTEIVVVTALADGADNVLSLFGGYTARGGPIPDGGDIAGTSTGFWLALPVLAALTLYSVGSLARRRFAAIEEEMRTPGTDLPAPSS